MNSKTISHMDKLYILLQPYIRKKEIKAILCCTVKKANEIFDAIIREMILKNYRIFDYNVVPTKLFMNYCQIEIEDFARNADIELQLNRGKIA